MSKTQSFDVTKNLLGLEGLNINNPINSPASNDNEISEKKDTTTKNVVKEEPKAPVEASVNSRIIIKPSKKKETKTVHKNFLITEKRSLQFKQLAQETGQNENELFNNILDNIFGEN